MRSTPRALQIVVLVAAGLGLAALLALGALRRVGPERLARGWSRGLLGVMGIRVQVRGRPAIGARLTVANHVSWLDIPVIASIEATRFVSKSDVRGWPLAGALANAAGTFYLRRGKGGARPLLRELVPHLAAGGNVVLFPEGTTTDGRGVQPFHARLFEAAIEAGCPVQPLALRYGPAADGEAVAPFIGEMNLVAHLVRLLREPGLVVEAIYFPPIPPQGCSRDDLAGEAHALVRAAVTGGLTAAEWGADPELAHSLA